MKVESVSSCVFQRFSRSEVCSSFLKTKSSSLPFVCWSVFQALLVIIVHFLRAGFQSSNSPGNSSLRCFWHQRGVWTLRLLSPLSGVPKPPTPTPLLLATSESHFFREVLPHHPTQIRSLHHSLPWHPDSPFSGLKYNLSILI